MKRKWWPLAVFVIAGPWMVWALGELGVQEAPGPDSNPRVEAYLAAVPTEMPLKDATPWCSAFVNWSFQQCGILGTESLLARSWQLWGYPLEKPQLGCVVVLQRGRERWQGHVGFWQGYASPDDIYVLGGNQSDRVCVDRYPRHRLLSYRWPHLSPERIP